MPLLDIIANWCRFDLYHTLIQYVQSRGRARHSDSIVSISQGYPLSKNFLNSIFSMLVWSKEKTLSMKHDWQKFVMLRYVHMPEIIARTDYSWPLANHAKLLRSPPWRPITPWQRAWPRLTSPERGGKKDVQDFGNWSTVDISFCHGYSRKICQFIGKWSIAHANVGQP